MLVVWGSCAFAGGLSSVWLAPRLVDAVVAQTGQPYPASDIFKLSDRFSQVAERVAPAVVAIEASKPAKSGKKETTEEAGSGVLVRLENRPGFFVITNNHVVSDARPENVSIALADGRLFRPARILADPESDIALLPIETNDLPTALMGDSVRMRVGQWVLAVGSPFGLNQTVTHGIISARNRGQVSLGSSIRIKDFLQTDAAINPGSSGGPLINMDGEVIGINTAIASHNGSNSGVAFSIPINLVKRVSQQLLDRGSVARGYLGVQLAASFEAGDALKLGLDRAQGALVETVLPETPAAVGGLRANDVVLQVNGVAIRNESHLINLVSTLPAGQRIRVVLWRDRQSLTVEVVIGDWTKAQSGLKPG
jgi:S1-C subfamily serine protease